jgi:flavin reductase (DIM6/NTAB) family NADH-FMN oxidoreductase RutF
MGKFATGVTAVSYLADGQPAGLSANAFARCRWTRHWCRYQFGTHRASYGLEPSGRYGINFLACGQHHISDRF